MIFLKKMLSLVYLLPVYKHLARDDGFGGVGGADGHGHGHRARHHPHEQHRGGGGGALTSVRARTRYVVR